MRELVRTHKNSWKAIDHIHNEKPPEGNPTKKKFQAFRSLYKYESMFVLQAVYPTVVLNTKDYVNMMNELMDPDTLMLHRASQGSATK